MAAAAVTGVLTDPRDLIASNSQTRMLYNINKRLQKHFKLILVVKNKTKMAYDKFNILTSTVPLSIENVDTDQIIPARFLKATERVGFGDNLSATGDTTMTTHLSQISF
jgi:hypothetical protein